MNQETNFFWKTIQENIGMNLFFTILLIMFKTLQINCNIKFNINTILNYEKCSP